MSTDFTVSGKDSTTFVEKLSKINSHICRYREDDFLFEFLDLDDHIESLWQLASCQSEQLQCIETTSQIPIKAFKTSLLNQLAFKAFDDQNYVCAAQAFMRAAQAGDKGAKNNFAYMIRKQLFPNSNMYSAFDVLKILHPALKEKESFSIVNTSLVLSLMLGSEDDWKTADILFSRLAGDLASVVSWWEKLGQTGDPEGMLVHFWMLRHNCIQTSTLGTADSMWEILQNAYPNIPLWLKKPHECTSSSCAENDSVSC